MSQNSTVINDGTGAQVLQAINDALDTIVTLHSGTSEPGNPVAGMLWLDTSSNRLKIRNSANTAWTDIGSIDESGLHSASEILNKIKTVDGAGSGLDADTVDGIQGADVMTRAPDFDSGWVAISANQTIYINHNLGVSPTKITTLMKPDGNGNAWGLVDTVNPRPIDGMMGSDGNMYRTSIEGVSGTQFIIRSGTTVWHGVAPADGFYSGFIRILAWL